MTNEIKEKIREFCFENKYPVFFPDQIEKHKDHLIMTRSDGLQLIFTVLCRPILINDNDTIKLEVSLNQTAIKKGLSNSTSF